MAQKGKETILQKLRNLVTSFRLAGGLDLPDGDGKFGRSSVEDLPAQFSAVLSQYGGLVPEISFEYLALLRDLFIWHPLMNQFAANIIHLGNTGHHLMVDAANAQQAEHALGRINETATRLWPHGAGVDGLLNHYFFDLAWSGAISSEDVVNFTAKRVEKVVIVPVEQIRFTWDGEHYLPHQQPKNTVTTQRNKAGMIPLNRETYRYYALDTLGSSPYAKPPATAALDDLTGPFKDGRENLRKVIKKYGILGFAALQVNGQAKKPGETDEEHNTRMKAYLKRVMDAVQGSFAQGLLGMFRDQKLEFHNVTSEARGLKDVWEILEGQIFNGTAMQPAFFGRVHSTTETFADVVYALLDAQASNFRRPAKRRMERTYTLDLLLAGIPFYGVGVKFNRTPSRNMKADAEAEQIKTQTVLEKAKSGIISPDQAAQELGYEAAFDPELLGGSAGALQTMQRGFSARFRFDGQLNRYEFVPERIELSAPKLPNNVVALKKKIV